MSIEARPELVLIAHRRIVTHYRHFKTDEYKGLGNIITPGSPSITPDTLLRMDSTYPQLDIHHQDHIDHSNGHERRRAFRRFQTIIFQFLLHRLTAVRFFETRSEPGGARNIPLTTTLVRVIPVLADLQLSLRYHQHTFTQSIAQVLFSRVALQRLAKEQAGDEDFLDMYDRWEVLHRTNGSRLIPAKRP